MTTSQSELLVTGATIIDGVSDAALEGRALLVVGKRIKAIGHLADLSVPPGAKVLDASGRFVIPGLLNANVHLLGVLGLEGFVRYRDRYEDLIEEAAQIALKNGLTTVFDTYGPRRYLCAVRDRINAGEIPGSRVFCAGNIVGFEGPFSSDFYFKESEIVSGAFSNRINAIWVENVGRRLAWMTPAEVATEVRAYIRRGLDFVKYGSNDHFPGAFLLFSPDQQLAIVRETHSAGLTAQAHSTSVEGLKLAVEAGCDLVTHCNITGPTEIPPSTLELMLKRDVGAVLFPFTKRRLESLTKHLSTVERVYWYAADRNASNLAKCGARLLLANDGALISPEWPTYRHWGFIWATAPGEDNLFPLDTGHFAWLKAMEEKGCPPMELLRAATRNIAVSYGKDGDLGTLEPGKLADFLVLTRNPLEAAENYRSIEYVVKDGFIVDRDALPLNPMLTAGSEPPAEEEARYVSFASSAQLPACPFCVGHHSEASLPWLRTDRRD